jgi:regulator of sirC expression with transglutaminase-like and TPR domain
MYDQVSDLTYFRTLVADPQKIPLLEAAASLAQDEYPGLDLEEVLSSVDVLARRLLARCRDHSTELKRLQETSLFFYKDLGFAGNVNDYYDPDNSLIHRVLMNRRGIPISLAVLYVELARAVGLDADGVSFPGHFLIKVNLHEGPVVLDPFTGYSLSQEDILGRLDPYRKQLGLVGENEVPTGLFLQAATSHEILLRMLRNLREIYRQQGQFDKLKKVLDRTLILDPSDEDEKRLRASLGA